MGISNSERNRMLLSDATQLGLEMSKKFISSYMYLIILHSSRLVILGFGTISFFHARCRFFFEPAVMPRSTGMVFWFAKAVRFCT